MAAENLTKVTLRELYHGERISYDLLEEMAGYAKDDAWEFRNELAFYVDKETNLALPLKIMLFPKAPGNPGPTGMFPNQPVMQIDVRGEVRFYGKSVTLPMGGYGYEFVNVRGYPATGEPYFEENNWGILQEAKLLEARLDMKFDDFYNKKEVLSVVRYKI